jgi:hypothetical protein
LSHTSCPFCSGYFGDEGLMNYLPRLASDHNPPDLSLPNCYSYRHEPLVPYFSNNFWCSSWSIFRNLFDLSLLCFLPSQYDKIFWIIKLFLILLLTFLPQIWNVSHIQGVLVSFMRNVSDNASCSPFHEWNEHCL